MPQDEVPLFAMQGEVIREARQESKADAERKTRITYHRRSRTSAPANCDDCVDVHVQKGGTPLRPAVYLRKQGERVTLLCYEHKQDRLDREWLDKDEGKKEEAKAVRDNRGLPRPRWVPGKEH